MNLKKLSHKKKQLDEIINLIPMINLIFLLLIFFLLTGVVSKRDTIKLERPSSDYGVKADSVKNEVTFTLDENNKLYFNNLLTDIDGTNEILRSKDKKFIIDVDKDASIYLLNKLIKKMKENKIEKVFFKVSGDAKK